MHWRSPQRDTLLAALLVLAACGPPASTDPPAVRLDDEGCSRSGAESLPAGDATVAVRNESGGVGVFSLLQLDGSYLDVTAHVAQEQARIAGGEMPGSLPETVHQVDRLSTGPMESAALEATLTPGTYAVICARMTSTQGEVLGIFSVGPWSVSQ